MLEIFKSNVKLRENLAKSKTEGGVQLAARDDSADVEGVAVEERRSRIPPRLNRLRCVPLAVAPTAVVSLFVAF